MGFDPERYATHHRESNRRERERIRESSRSALEAAREIADRIIRSDAGVKRVILFGSLAEGEPKNLDFDIDLALDGGDVYKAMEIAEEYPWKVDIADMRLIPDHVRARIEKSGKVLRERGSI